jgi:hypothetical protein
MGLAIDPILENDEELQTCLTKLQAKAPELFDTTGEIFRQSEHERSLIFNGYWFTVVYDLLRMWGDRAEIVDWKTYLKPRNPKDLKTDWQTRLYLYVLVETTQYDPEQVALTYWFVRAENSDTQARDPQQVRIPYTAAAHTQTRQDLERLTHQLTQHLESPDPFPQVPLGSDQCDDCPFAVRCQRSFARSTEAVELPGWDEIEEVAV